MQLSPAADPSSAGMPLRASERRKHVRFDMHFMVFLRALGEPWASSETTDVSATGALFVTNRPFLLSTPLEYVLTFPKELTKAQQPLRVRFYSSVLRCERIPGCGGSYSVAVRNTAHRYLTSQEAAPFDVLEHRQPLSGMPRPSSEREIGT